MSGVVLSSFTASRTDQVRSDPISDLAEPGGALVDGGGGAGRGDGLAAEVGQEAGAGAGEGAGVGEGVGDAGAAQRGCAGAAVVGGEQLARGAGLDRRADRVEHVALGQHVAALADLEVVAGRRAEVVVDRVQDRVAAELGLLGENDGG